MERIERVYRLAPHRHLIPAFASWFEREWPDYYGPGGPGNAKADLNSWCNEDSLPSALIAIAPDGAAIGIVAIKQEGLGTHLGLGPWLSALLVAKPYRRNGIGTQLITGAIELARDLGLTSLYAASNASQSLFTRSGWAKFDFQLDSLRGPVSIYKITFRP